MANRSTGYGLSAEVRGKIDAKYDTELEQQAVEWIISHIGDDGNRPSGQKEVQAWLKDGQVLCKLINTLQPGSVRKVNTNKMAFKQMENIGNFLKACENYGMNKNDAFQTVDLYEGNNMAQVICGIHALGRQCHKKGQRGLGPKEADKNKREFTQEQMQAGKNVIGLQMGTNKLASQAGQSFGKTRHIID